MYTYQDLLAVENLTAERNETNILRFVKSAIAEHISSDDYKTAVTAEEYDAHRNVTINEFQKVLYKVTGETIADSWSANYKIATNHYNRFTTQEVNYLLGNGANFAEGETITKLGNEKYEFNQQLVKMLETARKEGEAFGFFNVDHIDVFKFTEFKPLYDEEDGSLKAGIRFWQIDSTKPQRAVLYELDGYTQYMWYEEDDFTPSDNWTVIDEGTAYIPQTPYILNIQTTEAGGIEMYEGLNYPTFPIVPMWGNEQKQSTLVGLREAIDCYDLIKSGFANTVDDASMIYWTLEGAGGMDDIDLQEFVDKVKRLRAVNLPPDVTAQANTVSLPYQASEALLNKLDRDLYKDAMALDVENIASGAVTATQIKAAYEPLNLKTDRMEYLVKQFVNGILAVAGIEDTVTFTRSKLINTNEEIQTILQASGVLPSDYVVEKIVNLLGDGDRLDEILAQNEEDEASRFDSEGGDGLEEEEEPEDDDLEDEDADLEEEDEEDDDELADLQAYADEVTAQLEELLKELEG